jgi:WhiB family redox-sensing transcriptional regulator
VDWNEAACAGYSDRVGYDPFFPQIVDETGEEYYDDGTIWAAFGDTDPYYEEARSICNSCPIKEQCLEYAIERKERWGMWGGSTPIERRRVERRERRERLKQRRANELDQ